MKYVGYELRVRVTFPANDVDIAAFMDAIRNNGSAAIEDVTLLNSATEADKFLSAVDEE